MAARGIRHHSVYQREKIVRVSNSIEEIDIETNKPLDLASNIAGNSHDPTMILVEACTTEKGLPAVWILLEKTGRATFFNKQGNISACTLNDELKVGSMCNAMDPEVLRNSTLH